jgi:hypothetical protein
VCHRQVLATQELAAERLHDAALTLQDVPEAHAREARRFRDRADVAQEQLADALGRTHHVGRPDGLVGRDVYDAAHTGIRCSLEDVERAADVIVERLDGVGLHERNVLVSGHMEDEVGLGALHDLRDPGLRLHVGDLELQGVRPAQRLPQVEDRRL